MVFLNGTVCFQKLFVVNAVCRSWRAAARELLVQGMWKSSPFLTHPAQLFILVSSRVAPRRSFRFASAVFMWEFLVINDSM